RLQLTERALELRVVRLRGCDHRESIVGRGRRDARIPLPLARIVADGDHQRDFDARGDERLEAPDSDIMIGEDDGSRPAHSHAPRTLTALARGAVRCAAPACDVWFVAACSACPAPAVAK